MVQSFLVAAGGLGFAGVVLVIARRGRLSLRFTLGWWMVAALVVAVAFLSPVLRPLASSIGITPTGFLLAAASGVLTLITLQLSVTASGLRDAIQTLAEAQALLEERVRRTEGRDGDATASWWGES